MRENLREKVEETISFLPPLPSVMTELIAALRNDDVDFNVLGKIISTDPSMAMNVMKIANSASFGLPKQVTTLGHAIGMLGTREIISICISCGASRSLKPPKGVETVDMQRFWRHSVATGVIAKIVFRRLGVGQLDDLYLSGLVHDVGAVVLDRFKHDVYREIIALTYEENISILEAEERIMGASHDTVGGWLMQKWKLSDLFVEVASCHHHVGNASEKHRTLVAVISRRHPGPSYPTWF